MIKFAVAMLLFAIVPLFAAGAEGIHSLAQAVDEHYNQLTSLQAEFTEIYRGNGMERTESGMVWLKKPGLKKPGKMRWEYRSPREKLFVSDGKEAWFYVSGDRQARKSPARKLDDIRSPLAFLLGKTKLEKELRGLSLASDISPLEPQNSVLRGTPQGMADRVTEVLVEITPGHQIERLIVDEVDGSSTEYRFSNQKEDVKIADNEFQFTPPAGTEIVEGDIAP
ncbi:MAG TPA: outer-membrane lipoprotein carrier protein LolA [Candidatus Sulfotelmatobacter sp.]